MLKLKYKILLFALLLFSTAKANTIISAEYFWNTDPGIGNGIAITVPTASDSVNFNAPISAAGLKAGYHVLYIRTKDNTGKWSLSEGRVMYVQPTIVAAEYFWNTDPGINNGTALSAFATDDSINITRSISSAGLKKGYHTLYTRTKDTDGIWSLSEGRVMYVQPKITEAEYFWDTDPGVDVATKTSAFTATDSLNFNPSITTTGLQKGYHTLYTRTKDTDGIWSLSEGRVMYVQPKIVEAEYFWNTDPGIDVATKTSPFTATDSLNFNPTITTTGLKKGYHTLYTRTKDTDGKWSLSEGRSIYIEPKITASEYFWDIDPGQGSGIALSSFTASDSINTNTSISTTGVRSGYHTFYTRTKDVDNTWSLSEGRTMYVQPQIGGGAGESFWDTDPGFGNGTPCFVFSPSDSINLTYTTSTVGLSPGLHTFYMRFRTTENKWSLAEGRQLYITKPILAVEYFIDTDPGVGLATNVPITPADTVILTNINVPITGLARGNHNLYIRSKSFDKVWSTAEVHPFTVDVAVTAATNIVAGEYFIDTDPGAGLGTALSLTTVNDTIKVTQGISVAGYATGLHHLYMRYKSSGGNWSVAEVRPFNIDGPIAAATNIVAGEYFIDTDPGVGAGTAVSYTVVNDTVKAVQGISVAGYAPGLHHLYMRYKTNANAWSAAEVRPFTIDNNITVASNIIAGEYFVDTDPGPGLGTALTLTTVNDTVKVAQGIPVAAYSPGIHHLYMRYKSYGGNWSVQEIRPFYIHSTVTTITHLEYFIDTDPGVGLATAIPVTGAPNDTVIVSVSKLLPCLSNGNHYMYLRAKNNLGVWSVVDMDTINVTGTMLAQPIVSLGADTVCSPATVTMYADSTTDIAYQWLLNGNVISGATFATYTATSTGNYSLRQTCNASVVTSNVKNIVINVAPIITTCPGVASVNNDGGLCSAIVTYAPAVASSLPIITYSQNSGTAFPVGTTTVYVVATNNCGVDSCQFNVVVADTALPVIANCPANVLVNNTTGLCTGIATWTAPTANDNCTIQTLTSSHNSGAAFPVGTSTVTYTATDIHGNLQTCSFNVVVTDNQLPSISAPSPITTCSATPVLGIPVTNDNCGVDTVYNNAPAIFPAGNTTVTWTVEDIYGNLNTANQLITVVPNVVNIGNDDEICAPNVVFLNGNITGSYVSIAWTTNGDGSFINATTLSPTYTPGTNDKANGTVILTLTANGNPVSCTSSDSKIVKIRTTLPLQPSVVSGAPVSVCPPLTGVVLSVTNDANVTTYSWANSPGSNGITFNPVSTTNTQVIDIGATGNSTYNIRVTATNACGSSLYRGVSIRRTTSTPASITGTVIACAGQTYPYSIAAVVGADTYTWTAPANASINGGGNTLTTASTSVSVQMPAVFTTGTLSVTANVACFVSPARTITLSTSTAALSLITGSAVACPGSIQTYTVPAVTGATSYQWTLPTYTSGTSSSNNINVTFNTGFSSANICVQATSVCGVQTIARCKSVATGLPPTPTAINGIANGICGQTVNYNTPAVPGATGYVWTLPAVASGSSTNNSILVTYQSTGITTAPLTVQSQNSCGLSLPRTITVKGAPNSPGVITANPASWCNSNSGITFTSNLANVTGSYNLVWSFVPPTAASIQNGQGSNNLLVDWNTGNATVILTATNSCGSGSKTYSAVVAGCREAGEEIVQLIDNIAVYPNPANDKINVMWTSISKENVSLLLTDISGKELLKTDIEATEGLNKYLFDLSTVAKGVYVIQFKSPMQSVNTRIVVQ